MMDMFFEQIVKQKPNAKRTATKLLILIVGIILLFGSFLLMYIPIINSISFLASVGIIYFTYILFSNQNIEFEYIYTNGEVDIDKIVNRKKRKRILTVKISSFDKFDNNNKETILKNKYDKFIDASSLIEDEDTYYATFRTPDSKSCVLFFTPNKKLLDELLLQLKKKTFLKQ